MNLCIKVVDQLSKFLKRKKIQSTNGTNVYCKIGGIHILSYVDFSKLFHLIKYFTELNQNVGQKDITFPLSSSSRAIEW